MESIEVLWDNQIVGTLINPMPDMWYLDGQWESKNTSKSHEFVEACKVLDTRECMRHGAGIPIQLQEGTSRIYGLVLSPVTDTLFLRRIFHKETETLLAQADPRLVFQSDK